MKIETFEVCIIERPKPRFFFDIRTDVRGNKRYIPYYKLTSFNNENHLFKLGSYKTKEKALQRIQYWKKCEIYGYKKL